MYFSFFRLYPDYNFLGKKNGIHSKEELKNAIGIMLSTIDLNTKKRDFEHLLFDSRKNEKILLFPDFIKGV